MSTVTTVMETRHYYVLDSVSNAHAYTSKYIIIIFIFIFKSRKNEGGGTINKNTKLLVQLQQTYKRLALQLEQLISDE